MPENGQTLGDVRVLDLSEDIAGPFCSRLLAALGAEVVKVERPGSGDMSRRAGPSLGTTPHPEQSALFLYLNTGKKSITLNVESPTGAVILRRLARECDILVESFPPGYLDGLDLGYPALEQLNPQLIYTSVTAFGQSGPYLDPTGEPLGRRQRRLGQPRTRARRAPGYLGPGVRIARPSGPQGSPKLQHARSTSRAPAGPVGHP